MNDLQDAIKKNPPDIKLLQLLLQGSISTQVYIICTLLSNATAGSVLINYDSYIIYFSGYISLM